VNTPEQRRRLRAWRRAHAQFALAWRATDLGRMGLPAPLMALFPPDLRGMLCGARTRAGTPGRR
jgi:hypothetical protein